jgi:selenocysteine lyase/cysteine desulfurase
MDHSLSRREFIGVLGAGSLAPSLAAGQAFAPERIPVTSRELWPWMRSQLVLEPGLTWLDTARFGPTLRAVLAREFRSSERQSLDPPRYQAATFGPESIRAPLAAVGEFLGADPADLVLTGGAAEALVIVTQGLDLQPGDEVLTTVHDHPAAVYPWLVQAKRRGIKVVQLPQTGIPATPEAIVGRFAGAITPKTRVIAFSHVQYTDGTVMPAQEICSLARANGIFSIVDGAQAAGLLDLNLRLLGCDAYATCFHKWLNGPPGSGALYLTGDARQRLWPIAADSQTGWDASDRFGVAPAAAGMQSAPPSQAKFGQLVRYRGPELDALPLAFEFQRAVSRARIAAHVRELAAYLRLQVARLPQVEVSTPSHPGLSSGIVALRVNGRDHGELAAAMAREDGIVVGHVRHGTVFDALRVSLHASNEAGDVDRLVLAVQRRL